MPLPTTTRRRFALMRSRRDRSGSHGRTNASPSSPTTPGSCATSARTAQTLNSGISLVGSSAATRQTVRRLLAAPVERHKDGVLSNRRCQPEHERAGAAPRGERHAATVRKSMPPRGGRVHLRDAARARLPAARPRAASAFRTGNARAGDRSSDRADGRHRDRRPASDERPGGTARVRWASGTIRRTDAACPDDRPPDTARTRRRSAGRRSVRR